MVRSTRWRHVVTGPWSVAAGARRALLRSVAPAIAVPAIAVPATSAMSTGDPQCVQQWAVSSGQCIT